VTAKFAHTVPFFDADSPVAGTVAKLTDLLRDFRFQQRKPDGTSYPRAGAVSIRLVDRTEQAVHRIVLDTDAPPPGDLATHSRLEYVLSVEDFSLVAQGRVSPIDVFLSGRLRVRGCPAEAAHMLEHLRDGSGVTRLCDLMRAGDGDV
jgi:hypothetical protein